MSQKTEVIGGNMGDAFDDGVFDGVKKVTVGKDFHCVTYIKIEYEKDGKIELREHGIMRGHLKEFSVDYPNEYITGVGGSYDHVHSYGTVLIKSLIFKTSYGRKSPILGHTTLLKLGHPAGKEFMLEGVNGGKLLGFHGRSGDALDAIGAHFFDVNNTSLKHFNLQGGNGGNPFDDGGFDGVQKVVVGGGGHRLSHFRFEYAKGERMVSHVHGKIQELPQEFVVDYPNEHITYVEGTINVYLTSIMFKTSKGRASPTFGNVVGKKFMFEEKGFKLVGFCGRSGDAIDALGAHFAPLPTPPPLAPASPTSIKLEAQGGKGEVSWDDGVHDHVRKVYIGQGESGVTFVKFEYSKGSELLVGEGHGNISMLGTEEFVVDPDDYITSVKVYYEKLYGSKTEVITALIFKTFRGITSQQFGMESAYYFFLLEGGKITGFHGSSSDYLNSIGAYMSLSPTPMLRGNWIQVKQNSKEHEPGPRCSHTIAMIGDKMYCFGGERIPNEHIDKYLYVFDFKTNTWSIAPQNGDVPELACLGVSMVAIGTTLYVFGGRDTNRNYNGFYSYDTIKSEWKLINHVNEGPEARSFHSMACDDNNIYVFGGVSSTVRLNTLHAYNIVEQKWIELPNPGETCKARGGAGLVVVDGKIWVVYGFIGDEVDDVYCFDPTNSKWTKVETSGEKPWARSVFAIAVVGKYIVISGGEIAMDPNAHLGPGILTSGAFVLDTESLMWQKLEEGHSPRGWCASTSASIGGQRGLLMYGGKAPTNGRFDDIFFYGLDSA